MNKQYNDLLVLYKDFINIFNNWELTKNKELDYYSFSRLVRIFNYLTDILEQGKIIEKYGIKHYKVIESGEVI